MKIILIHLFEAIKQHIFNIAENINYLLLLHTSIQK